MLKLNLCIFVFLISMFMNSTAQELSLLRTRGTFFVDQQDKPVLLKGTNLGNWLLLETWMFAIKHDDIPDQYQFEKAMSDRFGEAEKERLMEIFRESWMSEKDFDVIKSFGMNCIRLPINHRILEVDEKPMQLKPDAFKWIDWTLEQCEKHGIYVILDLHGLPGGQTMEHTCGREGRNQLWESQHHRKRAVWIWQQIAKRYKDRKVVAAYDLMNEPYGGTWEQVSEVSVELYHTVREVDKNHIIILPGMYHSLNLYNDKKFRKLKNVAFTLHFYPGMFGSKPTKENHANFIQTLPLHQKQMKSWNAPLLVGEFNVVYGRAGGAKLMRYYYDRYAEYGWASTMWCYKNLGKRGGVGSVQWSMLSNAEDLIDINMKTASIEKIEKWFRSFATMEWDRNLKNLRTRWNRKEPVKLEELDFPEI